MKILISGQDNICAGFDDRSEDRAVILIETVLCRYSLNQRATASVQGGSLALESRSERPLAKAQSNISSRVIKLKSSESTSIKVLENLLFENKMYFLYGLSINSIDFSLRDASTLDLVTSLFHLHSAK